MKSKNTKSPMTLRDIPLSRLIIDLDATERAFGPDSPTARILARELRNRLHLSPPRAAPQESEVADER